MLAPLGQADQPQHLAGCFLSFTAGPPTDQQRHGHVLDGGELAQQVVELVDETQLVIAQLPPGRFRKRIQALAGHGHPAGIGLIQPAQQVQQRALARARGPNDGHHLAGRHGEVDVLQDGELACALVVVLPEPLALQHGLGGPVRGAECAVMTGRSGFGMGARRGHPGSRRVRSSAGGRCRGTHS